MKIVLDHPGILSISVEIPDEIINLKRSKALELTTRFYQSLMNLADGFDLFDDPLDSQKDILESPGTTKQIPIKVNFKLKMPEDLQSNIEPPILKFPSDLTELQVAEEIQIPFKQSLETKSNFVVSPPTAHQSQQDEESKQIYDKHGVPWDKRIHSAGKSIRKKDGKWRPKKNLDAKIIKQVEKELEEFAESKKIPVTETNKIPPPPPPLTPIVTLVTLIDKIEDALKKNILTEDQIVNLQKSMGIDQLTKLVNKFDLMERFNQNLDLLIERVQL